MLFQERKLDILSSCHLFKYDAFSFNKATEVTSRSSTASTNRMLPVKNKTDCSHNSNPDTKGNTDDFEIIFYRFLLLLILLH